MDRQPKKIGELLIEKGLITPQQLEDALEDQKRTKEFLGSVLIRRKVIKEEDLITVLSEQYKIPYVSIRYDYIDWAFVSKFSPQLIVEHKCMPLKTDEFTVTLAITNPLNMWGIKKAEEETIGFKLKFVLVSGKDMEEAIQRYKDYLQKRGL